jgi:hypothetical protein
LEGEVLLEDPYMDGRIILNCVLRKWIGRVQTRCVCPEYGLMTGCSETVMNLQVP